MTDAKWPYTGLPAQSEKLTEADFVEPTYEQSMTQPWKYPQGRAPLPASHPARITPPEDDDWESLSLTWPERLMVVGVWAASFAAAVAALRAVFS